MGIIEHMSSRAAITTPTAAMGGKAKAKGMNPPGDGRVRVR